LLKNVTAPKHKWIKLNIGKNAPSAVFITPDYTYVSLNQNPSENNKILVFSNLKTQNQSVDDIGPYY
jgi:hypothetical protein